ncbi:MAG: methyltransferase domain-containing protein [Gemmiger sp.]|nr:methyltransferase domain-containing protein [Gemmiger sp.]
MEKTWRKKLWKLRDTLCHTMSFAEAAQFNVLRLYAGDIPASSFYENQGFIGLSIKQGDWNTICHDITQPYPLADATVSLYQAEDVLEHIPYGKLVGVLDEIYRVLKPGCRCRLSLPDYRCDVYAGRCQRGPGGEIQFDPGGGGWYKAGALGGGAHLWFPTYEQVLALAEASRFTKWEFYHYYDENGKSITKPIDYSLGYIDRTPDHDPRVQNPYRALSIVVDLIK